MSDDDKTSLMIFLETEKKNMQNKKNQSSVGMMIQRCHKWRQKRKQYMDQARQTSDEIERERLMQAAEHYGRIVSAEQGKIDSTRDPKEKLPAIEENADSNDSVDSTDTTEDEESVFPDFITAEK
ncbi:MAG TPA: hypothetical protein IAC63_02275 [Candidatus Enterousia avicola]|uniref:Uncharacterized protein n=1 Tax=Candidatus Enterousia avicola TaxID=2840787 RepID=A0A9D1MSE2_9PROT|nr:hypothetical protein [Candidatus Enterousia avicola]